MARLSRPARPRGGRVAGAFTLLEVMIVIVIILAIAGLVSVNLMSSRDSATKKTVSIQLASFRDALKQFNLEFNRYPTEEEGLGVLWSRDALDPQADAGKWRPFMDDPGADPWGTPYQYSAQPESGTNPFELFSNGPDKEPGTEDDISLFPKRADAADGGVAPPPPPPGGP